MRVKPLVFAAHTPPLDVCVNTSTILPFSSRLIVIPEGKASRVVCRRPGLRAAGAEAAGGRGAVLAVYHPAEERRADPQAGAPGQRLPGPPVTAAGVCQRPGQGDE